MKFIIHDFVVVENKGDNHLVVSENTKAKMRLSKTVLLRKNSIAEFSAVLR